MDTWVTIDSWDPKELGYLSGLVGAIITSVMDTDNLVLYVVSLSTDGKGLLKVNKQNVSGCFLVCLTES